MRHASLAWPCDACNAANAAAGRPLLLIPACCGCCRLEFVARRGAWSPATHCNWPDAFKAATNTLLLACCRTVGSGAGSVAASRGARPAPAGLASLPADVLLRILQLAAAPMSAWL